jgi:hypothetical protein
MKVAVLLITTLVALASATPVISLEPRQGIITDDPTKICNECKAKISTCTKASLSFFNPQSDSFSHDKWKGAQPRQITVVAIL